MLNPSSKGSGASLGIAVLAVVALVVVFIFFRFGSSSGPSTTIASVAGVVLRDNDLPRGPERDQLALIDGARYALLRNAAEAWVENEVLIREAEAKGSSVEEMVKKEAGDLSVSDAEVYRRYVQDPQYEKVPYEKALKAIRKDLQEQKLGAARREIVTQTAGRYGARVTLEKPKGYTEPPPAPVLPEVAPYPGGPDVAGGKVVGPPHSGKSDAPVVLEIFSDFMCPYSARFAETMRQLIRDYPDALRVEYRHYPLAFHKGADFMAEASVCAQEQGKFWEFHDALFANPKAGGPEAMKAAAKNVGLDEARFGSCLSDGKYRRYVKDDMAEGHSRGVRGTPGFFLNRRPGSGARPLAAMKSLVEWHLDPKGPHPLSPPDSKKPAEALKSPA